MTSVYAVNQQSKQFEDAFQAYGAQLIELTLRNGGTFPAKVHIVERLYYLIEHEHNINYIFDRADVIAYPTPKQMDGYSLIIEFDVRLVDEMRRSLLSGERSRDVFGEIPELPLALYSVPVYNGLSISVETCELSELFKCPPYVEGYEDAI